MKPLRRARPSDGASPTPRAGRDDAATEALGAAVAAAQAGDEAAFSVVYRTVQPALLRYLRVLVPADAEDVAAEAWLQIARDLAKFKGNGDDFRGWATTIARHRGLDHIRRAGSRPVEAEVDDFALLERPGADDTEAAALTRLDTDRAVALIATLPRDQAEAVMLRVVMGLDADAAGEVLGKRAGAVRTAAHRGLKTLAARLTSADAVAGAALPDPRRPAAEPPAPAGVTKIEDHALREVR
jgi:RNA polymerase sigma-70 factor (ECF subfamily)